MNELELNHLEYEERVRYCINSYIREFGERKFNKIFKKVMTSNKISGLISKAKFEGIPLGSSDYLYCLNEIPYFIFSNGQTQAVAALIALQRWNEEVNSVQRILNEKGLNLRVMNIIKESRITFT